VKDYVAVRTNDESGFRYACLAIAAINVAALIVEYVCTARIYKLIPPLAFKRYESLLMQRGAEETEEFMDEEDRSSNKGNTASSTPRMDHTEVPHHSCGPFVDVATETMFQNQRMRTKKKNSRSCLQPAAKQACQRAKVFSSLKRVCIFILHGWLISSVCLIFMKSWCR
jgi:hypothetical protein